MSHESQVEPPCSARLGHPGCSIDRPTDAWVRRASLNTGWRCCSRAAAFTDALRDNGLRLLVVGVVSLASVLATRLCGTDTTGPADGLPGLTRTAGIFTVRAPLDEAQAMHDVARALLEYAPEVGRRLGCDYACAISVELFGDQAGLDRAIDDPDARGHYAHSSDRHIRMITPRQPIPTLDVPYETRVLIAVHEFAHLVNNAVNPDMPLWLNEGAAVFAAPHAPYTYVCQHRFPFDRVPALRDLQQAYRSVPGADLFAFSAVEFIATEFELESLNRLVRQPDALEEILGLTEEEFEERWHRFMERQYAPP